MHDPGLTLALPIYHMQTSASRGRLTAPVLGSTIDDGAFQLLTVFNALLQRIGFVSTEDPYVVEQAANLTRIWEGALRHAHLWSR